MMLSRGRCRESDASRVGDAESSKSKNVAAWCDGKQVSPCDHGDSCQPRK